MHSNVAHVLCRNPDCQASYDQYVDQWKAWEPKHRALLPRVCGVCGDRRIIVTEARA